MVQLSPFARLEQGAIHFLVFVDDTVA